MPFTVQPPTALLARAAKTGKLAAFGAVLFANFFVHAVYSLLPAFFPAAARSAPSAAVHAVRAARASAAPLAAAAPSRASRAARS